MAKVSESIVTLRIIGEDLNPARITNLLGHEPSAAQTKGQIFISKSGKERTTTTGMWRLKTTDCKPENLEKQIFKLFDQLTQDLLIWKSISSSFGIDLFCGLFMEASNEGITIPAKSLSLLAERSVELSLDIYAPDGDV